MDLAEIDEKLKAIACGDSACVVRRPRGMATNGGCRCMAGPHLREALILRQRQEAAMREMIEGRTPNRRRRAAAQERDEAIAAAQERDEAIAAARREGAEAARRECALRVEQLSGEMGAEAIRCTGSPLCEATEALNAAARLLRRLDLAAEDLEMHRWPDALPLPDEVAP